MALDAGGPERAVAAASLSSGLTSSAPLPTIDAMSSSGSDVGVGLEDTRHATSDIPPATGDGDTLHADAAAPGASTGLSSTTRDATMDQTTVLPDVRDDGGRVVIVQRNERRYPVEKLLGEGGMGVVELARDADIDRRVAIKRLRDGVTSPASVARFVDEVRMIGRLDHPGIAPIHDVGVDANGAFFFVMKYIEGDTLEDVIDRLKAGDPKTHAHYGFEQRIAIFLSLLNALQYAHSAGLIHRDIKPANIMIGEYGEVLLMDWGIARPIGGDEDHIAPEREEGDAEGDGKSRLVSTRAGAIVGTPLYMSPEQARGETSTLDARSDIYSAGLLFFELLTLRHPLEDAPNVAAICATLQSFDCPSIIESVWSHPAQAPVPAELRHFLRRVIRAKREERPSSIAEVIADLEAVRSGDFRVQCPATFMKRMQRRSAPVVDAHPLLVNVMALLVVLSVLYTAVSVVYALVAG